jgi:hypothetical protein
VFGSLSVIAVFALDCTSSPGRVGKPSVGVLLHLKKRGELPGSNLTEAAAAADGVGEGSSGGSRC